MVTDAIDVMGLLLRQQLIAHPLPWRIEQDWTVEVRASDNEIIAKCKTHDQAQTVIECAEKLNRELHWNRSRAGDA